MEFFEVLKRRRSTRQYTGKAVSQEDLELILDAAMLSPVARARFEDMHLTVISDKSLLQAISDNARQKTGRDSDPLFGAPVLVLVSVKPAGEVPQNNEYSSAAMIAHNMTLAATALGLGSCDIWGAIGLANQNPELKARFGLPEGFVAVCSVTIGETDEAMPVRDVDKQKIAKHYIA
ncbi:MAG TPA: nitroreductase family protein [Anaerolineaceae bacterium]|nr:nitroreductase family protein [Anaerolineaceae bacterium]